MDNGKTFKRGEVLFREGDPITQVTVIKSGKVSLFLERSGKKIEIAILSASQALGEQGIVSNAKHAFSAEAIMETKVIEIGLEVMKTQFNGAPASIKLLTKSLIDQVKQILTDLRSIKMEHEKSPCPQVYIPKIFAILNSVARHTGKADPENPKTIEVDWGALKLVATRMFLDSPQRMRSLAELLTKLKFAEMKFEKNEEGDEELSKIKIYDIQLIEDFAEFYQYNLYKGSRAEVIYIDPLAHRVGRALARLAENAEVDRRGAVRLEFEPLLVQMKKNFGVELKDTHINVLEKKGLFVKRQATDKGEVFLSFDKAEFKRIATYWDILSEIDKWNDKGFVDMNESIEYQPPTEGESGDSTCPECKTAISATHKFCPNCGTKMAA